MGFEFLLTQIKVKRK